MKVLKINHFNNYLHLLRNVFKEDSNFSGGVLKPDDPAARSPTLRAGGGREAWSTSAADHLATRGHQQRGHVPRRAIIAVNPQGDGSATAAAVFI